jgi:6-phosphofructokinase 1
VLGHVQRGGTPTAFDRVLSTRFGLAAIDAAHDGAWDQMVALQRDEIVRVPLADATAELKTVSDGMWAAASAFFA